MSRTTLPNRLPFAAQLHPLTGLPIQALGRRRDGRLIWPLMGGDPSNDPQRPEDIPQETWDALGDPGKRALVSERSARAEAEKARDTAIRERDAARAKPGPPPGTPPAPPAPPAPKPGDTPDITAIVKQAVDAAIKPFQDAEAQREVEQAASKVRDVVLEAAKPLLYDPTDALANVDLASIVNDAGQADPAKVKTALEAVVAAKPHLAKSATRIAPPGIGGGAPAPGANADKVKAALARMQSATGIRPTPQN